MDSGIVAADAFKRSEQHAGPARDGDPALFGDDRRGLPDERGVGQALRRHEHARDGVDLALVHEVAAQRDELALDVFSDRFVNHDGVLGRAEHAVVERLAP